MIDVNVSSAITASSILAAITSVITTVIGPAPVLAAGIIGAMISTYLSKEKEKVWLAVVGVIMRGICGTWVALALPAYVDSALKVDTKVLAGLCAIMINVGYKFAVSFADAFIIRYKSSNNNPDRGGV